MQKLVNYIYWCILNVSDVQSTLLKAMEYPKKKKKRPLNAFTDSTHFTLHVWKCINIKPGRKIIRISNFCHPRSASTLPGNRKYIRSIPVRTIYLPTMLLTIRQPIFQKIRLQIKPAYQALFNILCSHIWELHPNFELTDKQWKYNRCIMAITNWHCIEMEKY